MVLFLHLVFLLCAIPLHGSTTTDSSGTDFWVAFSTNYDASVAPIFYITGPTTTTGTLTIPGLGYSSTFNVTAGKVTTVTVPLTAEIKVSASNIVGSLGIHIVAADNVTVYGLNHIPATTDAYLALPTAVLGEEYLVMAFPSTIPSLGGEFAIVGTADSTTVTITPSITVGTRAAGVAYSITLNQGQTYELVDTAGTSTSDISGTLITSDKPVAVYGGSDCADVPNASTAACNHLVEQMPPTSAWGKAFYTEPLATRLKGDTFRFLASVDDTTVSVNGTVVATLNRGKVYQTILSTASEITASQPILVAQYSNGTTYDNVSSDPFMMLVSPYEQYLTSYTVTTPASGFTPNFVNVIAPAAGVASLTLDGTAINASLFKQIGSSGYSGAQVPLAIGSHSLAGSVPFGIIVYGYASADGYGYIGGFSLSPVASVSSVSVSSSATAVATGSQACVSATVKDKNGNGLSGIRVDYTVAGANATTSQATTNGSGEAEFCYTGVNSGVDLVTGTVSGASGTTQITWSSTTITSSTALTSSASTITAGSALTLTAAIAPVPSGSAPGSVAFYNGSTLLDTVAVNSSGTATFATSSLSVGTYSFSAVYSGTSVLTSSTSSPVAVTVTESSSVTLPLQSTASITTSFDISAGTTIGSIAVVTNGIPNLDFTDAGTGTCAAGTYSSASTCTVGVAVSPKYPGLRYGAVELFDGNGNILGTHYVSAMGVAPQIVFAPGVQSSLGGGLSAPHGVAVDAGGNIFVADQANNLVKKIPNGCTDASCMITMGGGFSSPYGIALDGAGNILVSDLGSNLIKKIPSSCTTSACVSTIGGTIPSPAGIAVDANGNAFVAGSSSNEVVEIPNGCTDSSCMSTIGGGFSAPLGVAVDSNGNVFVADSGNNLVKKISSGCTTSACVSVMGGGISQPGGIAVNAAGTVFVGDLGHSAVKEIPGSCTDSSCVSLLSGTFASPLGLALSGNGNLFVGDSTQPTVVEMDFATLPSLSFPSTLVNSTSSAKSITASNDGNALLSFASDGLTAPTDFVQTTGSGTPADCAAGGTLVAGASCNLSIAFAPTTAGNPLSELFMLTNDAEGVSGTVQNIALSGTSTVPMTFTTPSGGALANGTVDSPFSQAFPVNGGAGSITYSHSGTLPAGLTLSSNGVLSGTPTAAGGPYTFTVIATDSSSASVSQTYTLTINRGTPTLSTWPTASAISYGQTLASSTLSGGSASVAGTYTFATPGTTPAVGTSSQSVTFTPTDSADYATVSGTVSVTVNKATPTVTTWPTASAINYGQTLASSVLTGGTASIAGSYAFVVPTTAPGGGTSSQSVTFAPTDGADYATVSGTVSVTVNKATATVALGNLTQTYTGSALAASATTNPSALTVNLTYDGSAAAPTAVGSYSVVATINDKNYAGTTTGTLVIAKVASAITVATSSSQSMLQSAITLTAKVSSTAGTPSGTVTFLDGTTPIGTATLSGGVASLSISSLTAGSHTLSTAYSGDSNFAAASSSSLAESVIDFSTNVGGSSGSGSGGSGSGSGSTPTQTILPGGTASMSLSIVPSNGVTSLPVASILTITGMPEGSTATVTPSTWTKTSSTTWTYPANVTLSDATVNIQVPSATARNAETEPLRRHLPAILWGMLLLPFAGRMRRTGKRLGRIVSLLLILAAGAAAMSGLSGCASNNGFFSQQQKAYTVTLTVTSGTLSRSTNMTLNVQ
jgi:hypothetical protein